MQFVIDAILISIEKYISYIRLLTSYLFILRASAFILYFNSPITTLVSFVFTLFFLSSWTCFSRWNSFSCFVCSSLIILTGCDIYSFHHDSGLYWYLPLAFKPSFRFIKIEMAFMLLLLTVIMPVLIWQMIYVIILTHSLSLSLSTI